MFKLLDVFLDHVSGKLASNLVVNLDEARENMKDRERGLQLQRESHFQKTYMATQIDKKRAKLLA